MLTCILLDSLPEAVRAEAVRLGKPCGPRVEIDVAVLRRLHAPAVHTVFSGRALTRTERDYITTTYCMACKFNRAGRCSKCHHCGGGRRIEDIPSHTGSRCPINPPIWKASDAVKKS